MFLSCTQSIVLDRFWLTLSKNIVFTIFQQNNLLNWRKLRNVLEKQRKNYFWIILSFINYNIVWNYFQTLCNVHKFSVTIIIKCLRNQIFCHLLLHHTFFWITLNRTNFSQFFSNLTKFFSLAKTRLVEKFAKIIWAIFSKTRFAKLDSVSCSLNCILYFSCLLFAKLIFAKKHS